MMIYTALNRVSRHYFTAFVSFFFVITIGVSAPASAKDADVVQAKPAVWVVEKNQSKTYFLGSFHLLPKNYRWYDGIIGQSFESADQLVMESIMTPDALAEIQGIVVQNGSFVGADNLKNHLDEAHYTKMLGYTKKLMGLDEATSRKMKPWFMAINLSLTAIMSSGMDPNSGVDKRLEGKAKQRKMTISGLETAKEAMTALVDHPMDVQAAMLSETLDQLDDFTTIMTGYLEAWATGDGDKMSQTMLEDMKKYQGMYEALIVKRNQKWLPAIESHIKSDNNIFIVVGAAHLFGPDGLVETLRAKGYKVDKIQ